MALRVGTPLPSLEGATTWLDGPVSAEALKGHPVIIHFWAVSCPFCLINAAVLESWKQLYGARGLQFVAIHLPRVEADFDVTAVVATIKELNLKGPCALDNAEAIGERFETGEVWPHYFLFDAEGKLRSRAAGGQGLKLVENSLRRLMPME